MLRYAAIVIIASVVATGANACPPKHYFQDPAKFEFVCALEKDVPFKVYSRRIWDDHIAFFQKPKFTDSNYRTTTGLVFDGQGKPFSSNAAAEKIAKKIADLKNCEVETFKLPKGKPMELTLLCRHDD
ncbi:hypothetical protein [Thalassovita mangrovi]|uniref:Uncharacterized protein n=1 Tax=Thalassovita mangrovi TaxID=2692236 RepID=A0A6L8LLM7_9RHOB|nr:hypothetical protein [Thalassovita mangrovi]MYM54009.1 hypothetical protein [Thalassovita mangrovi]